MYLLACNLERFFRERKDHACTIRIVPLASIFETKDAYTLHTVRSNSIWLLWRNCLRSLLCTPDWRIWFQTVQFSVVILGNWSPNECKEKQHHSAIVMVSIVPAAALVRACKVWSFRAIDIIINVKRNNTIMAQCHCHGTVSIVLHWLVTQERYLQIHHHILWSFTKL
jgi:hypothetical protein